jgi:hypothetical protein
MGTIQEIVVCSALVSREWYVGFMKRCQPMTEQSTTRCITGFWELPSRDKTGNLPVGGR